MPTSSNDSRVILLINDSLKMKRRVGTALADGSCAVISANDYNAALAAVSGETVAAIVINLDLCNDDGAALCARFKSDPRFRRVPVLLCAQICTETTLSSCHDAGGDDFFSVTTPPEEISARIHYCVNACANPDEIGAPSAPAGDTMEMHLRQSQKMESIGLLAEGIAHDLNNILGGMIGYISLLKAKAKAADSTLPVLDMIEKSSERASEIISQLLDFAKNKHIELQPLDLNPMIKQSLNLIKSSIRFKLGIRDTLKSGLPAIWADSSQMVQAIMNLSLAGIHSIFTGIPELAVETALVSVDNIPGPARARIAVDHVCMTIDIVGVGSGKRSLGLDGDRPLKKIDHAGLELAIARHVINDCNGILYIDTEKPDRTIFTVYLPIYSRPESENSDADTAESVVGQGAGYILVVDDEAIVLQMILDTLDLLGYNGLSASTGTEGIEIFKARMDEIDLVILDLYIPDVPGEEIITELRKLKPDIKILVASGYEYRQKQEKMKELKVNAYLTKPFKLHDLEGKLSQLL